VTMIGQDTQQRVEELREVQQQQRLDALQRANGIRLPRAQLHREAKAGVTDVAELIADPPHVILTAEVGTVVEWMPGVGRWRSKQILAGLARPETLIASLSVSTRGRIATRLREQAGLAA
jgi:hypothetical protein